MKKISLLILAVTLTIASCKNYDDEFTALNASIAELQTQVAGFSAVQTSITALQASMASLTTAVASIPKTQVDISGLTTGLAAANASITALQAQLAAIVANYATDADVAVTTAAVSALADQILLIKADIAEILATNNVYDGDLDITNDAQLAFAVSLGDKIGIINGDVWVDITDGLDAAAVSAVTSKIMTVTGNVTIDTDAELDFSKLASVGDYYDVEGFDVKDNALTSVGDWAYFDYDGGYNQPNLESASGVWLVDYATTTTQDGTLTVNFRNLETANLYTDGSGNYTAVFDDATSVIINQGVRNLTANSATTVQVWAANNKNGLTISATEDASVITIAGRVDNGDSPSVGQALSVSGSATSVLNAAAVIKTSTLSVGTIATALSFPALTTASEVTAATVSFSAPLMVASTSVTLVAAKTVSIASTPSLVAGVVETLTFSALASTYAAGTSLKTATVTGKVGSTNGFSSAVATNLISATFAGELDYVSITGLGTTADKLTSLTTTGAIDSFTLDNSDVITAISLGHSHIAGGAGSVVAITNNAKLASLTTSTNFLKTLTVTGNIALTSMNFASYTTVIATGAISVTITGNKLSGDYTAAVAAGANPYVETTIASTSLVTLKPFVAAFKAATTAPATSAATMTISVDLQDVEPATGTQTLSAAQTADSAYIAAHGAWTSLGSLATVNEFLLVK